MLYLKACAIIPEIKHLGVAQLVARYLGVVETASSSLVFYLKAVQYALFSPYVCDLGKYSNLLVHVREISLRKNNTQLFLRTHLYTKKPTYAERGNEDKIKNNKDGEFHRNST